MMSAIAVTHLLVLASTVVLLSPSLHCRPPCFYTELVVILFDALQPYRGAVHIREAEVDVF